MVNRLIKIVEIPCKTICKTQCIFREYFCEKLTNLISYVENHIFLLTFPTFSTHFFTTKSPLTQSNIFHYSTNPTNTIINNLIERN